MLSLATTLGVTLGMMVVGSILIVDHNSRQTLSKTKNLDPAVLALTSKSDQSKRTTLNIRFVRRSADSERSIVPAQDGTAPQLVTIDGAEESQRGEEDYQAMRLAVRLASLLTFGVGAVIVFFTLRFSVSARAREFSLLLCLGEERASVGFSLVFQAICFGVIGSVFGFILAFPSAIVLLRLGISTTGRMLVGSFGVPWGELVAMFGVSLAISLSGVIGPVLSLYRISVVEILQPRFLAPDVDARNFRLSGLGWLAPAFLAATYLSFRPFLRSWLSVVEFFAIEVAAVGVLVAVSLWAMPRILRIAIGILERLLEPVFRLEALLVARRMRLTSQKLVFTIASVALVFSLLMALHTVTHALKSEIHTWAEEAVVPYAYYTRKKQMPRGFELAEYRASLAREKIELFRLSEKLPGEFPLRVIASEDLNPVRRAEGREPLLPGGAILSSTLAARFGVQAGDKLIIGGGADEHHFEIIEVSDDVGCYAESGPYVDLKSFAMVSDGNRLFADNLETTVGRYAMARSIDPAHTRLSDRQDQTIRVIYYLNRQGRSQAGGRIQEIDRDFLIFDFILAMTVCLAAIGIANSMLIQVDARQREFSVLRTIGIGGSDVTRLLLIEGTLIGVVGALLAVGLGNAIGALSVAFLDRFTLFHYEFEASVPAMFAISGLAIATCSLSAIYPAWVAANRSSAESLHYE